MHSTTGQKPSSSISTSSSSSTTTNNIEQYHYPPISTLRRPSRPSNIDLSVFDVNNTQQANDPGIYSAPICHLKQTTSTNQHHHHHSHHVQQSSLILPHHPHTATFHYQPPQQQPQQQQQQHVQLSSPHHQQQQQQHHLHQYPQQTLHHQQQQHLLDPFSQHPHTPHTFPLQASSNQYHHYFHFPPAAQNLGTTNSSTPPAYNQLTLQANVTTNGHLSPLNHRPTAVSSSSAANTSQPSTPTHSNRLLAVQLQEQQQQWSNPVLSPLMVKRINEGGNVVTSMPIDDDEDPSASIDALVADVDSSAHDLLDDQQNKSVDEHKTTSTTPLTESRPSTVSPSPHLYLRGTSHILTTPPNPLASNDHPDNQLTVANSFRKNFSPIHSAGFELTSNSSVQIPSSATARTSFFTFDTNGLEQNDLKRRLNNETTEDNQDKIANSLMINTDERTNTMSTNGLSQDDNSNHSSTNSNSQHTSSRSLSQMFKASGENKSRLSSSSPLSTDRKTSPLSSTTNKSQTNMSSMSPQQQGNRHYCSHPDCSKVFANKSALAKHKLTHCQDRRHKCVKCNKGFKRLDHLHGHMLTHEEEKPHKCRVPDCNRTYCDARSLKRHIENAHQNILAAIHEGGHDEYRRFLPETAFVKTKELSSDFSIDSVDSNSPRSSSIDNDQGYHTNPLRSSNGHKLVPTYTFDEEKCVECHICKKSFKNGAALNGHMRLHGGFNDKQPSPSSTDNTQKKKRVTPPGPHDRRQIKRKRPNSPTSSNDSTQRPILQRSMPIKSEEDDYMLMSPSSNPSHQSNLHSYQQSMYPTLPPCSDVLQQRFYDRTLSSRTRSISSSVIQSQTNPLSHPTIKNPMSVQPAPNISKQNRKQIPLPSQVYDRNNNHHYGFDLRMNEDALHGRINMNNHNSNHSLNIPAGILRFDHLANAQMFPNVGTMPNHDDKIRKTLSVDETLKYYHQDRQMNDFPSTKHPQSYLYGRSMSTQHHPTTFSQFPVSSHAPAALAPNIFHQILRHTNDMLNKEFYISRNDHLNQHHANMDDSMRYTPSTSPYATHLYHSPSPHIVHSPADRIPNPTASVINTPVTSPYSNLNTSHCSPTSSTDMCNNNPPSNSMQPSPLTNSVLSHAALKKRILNALKQEAQDEQQHNQMGQDFSPSLEQNTDQDNKPQTNAETSSDSSTLKIIPDVDSPIPDTTAPATMTMTKSASGFLIGTPSSSSTTTTINSSSSSSDTTHFNYENLPPTIPAKASEQTTANSNNDSFQWPSQVSQFRRQQSLNIASQTPNPLPTTPYTPPPMLSPFRKGPGLYYQVFSQTTPAATQQTTTVPTPSLPFTPVPDEISGPKINIGEKYQAVIPKLQTNLDDDSVEHEELLFSPSELVSLDETALDKYEQLSRTNPLLFSPRHSPTLYPIELVYMLLHEYKGDLQRTLAALLDGTASDIKQCRPLHRYHFPECETWTQEEINAFTKAMDSSEKNFLAVSRAVGTKTVKQCIEFHYMPKVHFTNRETGTNSLATKRKRLQMIKAKQSHSQKPIYDDDISSSPSCNEFRMDEDNTTIISDNSTITVFSCDIDDCLQTFTSERAYRAHRNDHRRIRNTGTPPTNVKGKSKS